jgi:hypothetical protein
LTPSEFFLPFASLALFPLLGAGSRRAVGWGLVGSLLIILGVAAAIPDWPDLAQAPSSFVAVSAGLAWLGIGCLAFGAWTATRAGDPFALKRLGHVGANLGITLAALVAADIIYSIWSLLYVGSWRGVIAAIGLAASGVVIGAVLPRTRLANAIEWLDDHWLARRHVAAPNSGAHGQHTTWYVILGAVVAVLLSHNLIAAAVEAAAVLLAAHHIARRTGRASAIPVQAIVAVLSLLAFTWGVRTIAGPDIPLHFPGILETPFSDAAEAALALVLGLGVWVMLGLWPWHGAGPGSAVALVGGAFLIRWGTGLIPDGIVHAAPIFAVVTGLAVLHAAATGRVGEYVAALGVLAVIGGGAGAWALFGLASLLATLRLVEFTVPIPGLDRRELGGIMLLPVLGWALPTMLTGETFVTVLAVLCGVALFRPMEG